MEAFRWVDARVRGRDGGVPDTACAGAHVFLQLDQRPMGRGVSFDAERPLEKALEEALSQLNNSLPPARDVVQEELRDRTLARVTISVELAGALVPIDPATFDEATKTLAPGLDGVACRRGQTVAGMFPSWMIGAGMTSGEALRASVSKALGDAGVALPGAERGEARAVRDDHALDYYRFRVVHLVQAVPRAEPVFLFRCGRIAERRTITVAGLRSMADGYADHLAKRVRHEGSATGVIGGYQFATGEVREAGAFERALAAFALARFGALRGPGEARQSAVATARRVMPRMQDASGLASSEVDDPVVCAMCLLALSEIVGLDPDVGSTIRAGLVKRMDATVSGAFGPDGWSERVAPGARGLVALALVTRANDAKAAGLPTAGVMRDVAAKAVGSIYADTPPDRLVSQMPWLGWAEAALAGDGGVPAAAALREMRDRCWLRQVGADEEAQTPDLVGGLVLTGTGGPLPTWHALRPLGFLTSMLGDPRFTDAAEVMPQCSKVLSSMRFVRQLTLDEASAYLAADPPVAIGGVRTATWEVDQPIEATSLALVTVEQAASSLERAAERLRK